MPKYSTLVDLKESLGIVGTNPTESPDAYLTNVLDRADAMIDGILGRSVAAQTSVTERVYVAEDRRTLNLSYGPLTALNDIFTTEAPLEALDLDDFEILGLKSYSPNWTLPAVIVAKYDLRVDVSYEVEVNTAYSAIPDDISSAAILGATFLINKRKDAATGSRDIGIGSLGSFRGTEELVAELRLLLARYIPSRVL